MGIEEIQLKTKELCDKLKTALPKFDILSGCNTSKTDGYIVIMLRPSNSMESGKIDDLTGKIVPICLFTLRSSSLAGLESKVNYTIDLLGVTKDTSDGYHTFDELYEFRKMYNAVLFNEWAKGGALDNPNIVPLVMRPKYSVHKSWRHEDGELCFGGNWFIVSAMLPTGLISNHYKAEDWNLFKVPEVEKALFKFDGHTGADVLQRLKNLL